MQPAQRRARGTWIRYLAMVGLLGLSAAPLRADQANVPVRYSLSASSTFQQGCFEPCACPLSSELPLRGDFVLTPSGYDGEGFATYALSEIAWQALDGARLPQVELAGSGAYRLRRDSSVGGQRMQLALRVGNEVERVFDSGPVAGGQRFPLLDLELTVNGRYCYDTVVHVVAQPTPVAALPRKALFPLQSDLSRLTLSLFAGSSTGALRGGLRLYLGDPTVPVPERVGMTGVSVDALRLVAPDMQPPLRGVPNPLVLVQDPARPSLGVLDTLSNTLRLDMYLTGPDGSALPVPMPLRMQGLLLGDTLDLGGDNGNVADGRIAVSLGGSERQLPLLPGRLLFSTEAGFTSAALAAQPGGAVAVSDGDLLERSGFVMRRNGELTGNLGIMPVVPDLGLDALSAQGSGEVWFSFAEAHGRLWSETMGTWLGHGDLLSERGRVVVRNDALIGPFVPMPVVEDAGLDAVAQATAGEYLFSVATGFFSERLGKAVGHGDLLSSRGIILRTNAELLAQFEPDTTADLGLDAIVPRADGELWFSVETGFRDGRLGWIGGGDLLSTRGRVVLRNLDLLAAFQPLEDMADFGLDALALLPERP